MSFYPVFFLIVGMLVLGLRLEDRDAWLLALLFAGFICGAPLFEGAIRRPLRGAAAWSKMTFETLAPGIFCYFFLTFPTPSPIDRRLPRPEGHPAFRDLGLFDRSGTCLFASRRAFP